MKEKINSILYIDDDPNLRFLLKSSIERAWTDCQVTAFAHVEDLIGYLMEKSADLLIVDYILPEMETARLLKIVRSLSEIPVIMISGLNYTEMKNISNIPGLIGILQKPFSVKTVSNEIGQAWARARDALLGTL